MGLGEDALHRLQGALRQLLLEGAHRQRHTAAGAHRAEMQGGVGLGVGQQVVLAGAAVVGGVELQLVEAGERALPLAGAEGEQIEGVVALTRRGGAQEGAGTDRAGLEFVAKGLQVLAEGCLQGRQGIGAAEIAAAVRGGEADIAKIGLQELPLIGEVGAGGGAQ